MHYVDGFVIPVPKKKVQAYRRISHCPPTAGGWPWVSALAAGTLSIWVKPLDRGPFTRLTFGGQGRRPPRGRAACSPASPTCTGAPVAPTPAR